MVSGTKKTKSPIANGQMIKVKKSKVIPVLFGLVVGILIMMLLRRCGDGGVKPIHNDTISVKIDTFYTEAKIDTHYIPKPYKIIVPYEVEVPTDNDSLILALAIKDGLLSSKSDSISVLRDYLTKKYYYDSFKVTYGKIYVADTVFANSIIGKGVSASFNVPTITRTFTVEAKKRTLFYLGGDIYGNLNSPIYGVGAAAGIKFRNDKYYEIKALLSKEGVPIYGFGFRLPIRLNKK